MIVGQPGSGKSTLAREIGARTGLPVVHVDHIHHLPGWGARPRDEKIAMALDVQAQPEWVFEGGLSATWEDRFARADTIIFLDFPLWLRGWRVIKRTLRYYGKTRPDMAEDCPERFNWEFTRWIWDTRHSGREGPLRLIADPVPGKRRFHLTSRADVRRFLAGLDAGAQSGQEPANGTL
nr:AAA family ATPase [Cognatishimia sp. F0-27]